MPLGRRGVAFVALLSMFATTGSAGAADDPPGVRPKGRAFVGHGAPPGADGVRVHGDGSSRTIAPTARDRRPARALEAAFTDLERARDPQTIATVAREYLEDAWQIEIPDPREVVAGHPDDGTSTDRYPLPAGDLDADGADDVLSIDFTIDDASWDLLSVDIRALSGANGSQLWGTGADDLYDIFPLPGEDLDGDGAADVLLLRLAVQEEIVGDCFFVACAIGDTATLTWTMSALSGLDGSELWSRRYDGAGSLTYADAGAVVAYGAAVVYDVTNALVLPIPSSDHDGDGAIDIIVNEIDVRDIFAVAEGFVFAVVFALVLALAESFETATRATVLGSDGDPLFARATELQRGESLLVPAGSDLLWLTLEIPPYVAACAIALLVGDCVDTFMLSLSAELLDGDDFSSRWSKRIEGPGLEDAWMWALDADTDGDGIGDLAQIEYRNGYRMGIASGATGSTMWSDEIDPWFGDLSPIGAVGGTPGDDVLHATASYDDDGFTLTLTRRDGATGATLFATTPSFDVSEDSYVDAWAAPGGDTDGDGVLDVVVNTYTYDFETEEETFTASIESGRTGDEVWNQPLGASNGFVNATDDLNGDGTADALVVEATWGFDTEIGVGVVALPSGAQLWHHSQRFIADGVWFGLFGGGDLNGDGRGDLIQYTALESYPADDPDGFELHQRNDFVEGFTGRRLWSDGDDLGDLAAGTGSITGTVTDEAGNPIEGICALAFEPVDLGEEITDEPRGSDLTAQDGTYTIDGLVAGQLVVRFLACRDGRWASQWYDGAATRIDADPVGVADDAPTPGIDAHLALIPPPAHDDVANAQVIAALPYSDDTSNAGAGVEWGEEATCAPIGATVWYAFTATTTGAVAADTLGSDFDTVLAVYDGEPSAATSLACSDDEGSLQSAVSFITVTGRTYLIQVGGYDGDTGHLLLNVG